MTSIYHIRARPTSVAVICPACSGPASFRPATMVRIARRKDLAFFEASEYFEVHQVDGTGGRWHGALHYPGLLGRETDALRELPDGYTARDWKSRWAHLANGLGALVCEACGHRAKHELDWPADAYYKIEHRGRTLWAFDRSSTVALRDFVASKRRDIAKAGWGAFLLRIPAWFLARSARETVVKRLDRLLRQR